MDEANTKPGQILPSERISKEIFFSNLLYLYLISKAPLMIRSSGFGKLAEKKSILVLYYRKELPPYEISYSQGNFSSHRVSQGIFEMAIDK